MNLDLFSRSPSGRLIKVGPAEATYWAFVPNPLPPALELDLPLVQALSAADRALGELAGLGRNMHNPHLLIQPFIRREAVLSSRIEGTQADLFEAIHPFLDGNGRVGRLLITLLLVHWDLLPLPLLYLSAYFERNRQQYYDGLLAVSASGDWNGWLRYFLAGVTAQAEDAVTRARELQDLMAEWQALLKRQDATSVMFHVTRLLLERPIVTAQDVMDRCAVSHQTAMRALQRLEALGILRKADERLRNQQFIADRIVEIIQRA